LAITTKKGKSVGIRNEQKKSRRRTHRAAQIPSASKNDVLHVRPRRPNEELYI